MKAQSVLPVVSYAVIDCRLSSIYRYLSNKNVSMATHIINDTITAIKHAKVFECDNKFIDHVVTQLYMMLLDIAFHREQDVHCRVRDMHYKIVNLCVPIAVMEN